ncbi:CDP-glycerol glycerophosphotransferase family protein, partial [Helcococcus bovis]
DIQAVKNQILIMPTWRSWFVMNSKIKDHSNEEFISSNYLRKWEELINSERFDALIKKYNLRVIFYPHRQMQPFIDEFSSTDNIIIANDKKYDVQNLLKTSKVLITDYSSVFFDMIYMKKPVMFYQFDYDEFREYQYKEGYFDYKDNSFGKSFDNVDDILINLEQIIKENYKVSDKYLLEHKEYFKYFDTKNSKRIVDILKSTNI